MHPQNKNIQQCYKTYARHFDWAEGFALHWWGLGRLRRVLYRGIAGNVLEVGAGTGLSFQAYPKAAQVTALDLSAEMLTFAQRRIRHRAHISLVCGDALALPFPAETFDVVTDCFGLCTYPDRRQALAEMMRVLKPRGQLLLIEHGLGRHKWLQRWQRKKAQKQCQKFHCQWDLDMHQVVEKEGLNITMSRRYWLGMLYVLKIVKK